MHCMHTCMHCMHTCMQCMHICMHCMHTYVSADMHTCIARVLQVDVYRSANRHTTCARAHVRVPQVAVYRSSAITSWIVRHILQPTTPHATLPNILHHQGWAASHVTSRHATSSHGKFRQVHRPGWAAESSGMAKPGGAPHGEHSYLRRESSHLHIPELLFGECTPAAITQAALQLLRNPAEASAQAESSARAIESLVQRDAVGGPVPSATIAARAVLRHLPTPPSPSAASAMP